MTLSVEPMPPRREVRQVAGGSRRMAGPVTDGLHIINGNEALTSAVRELWISSALRRVDAASISQLAACPRHATAGDIVAARVEKIGKNARVELPSGRAKTLHPGDELAVVFGNRYATNQFEGYATAPDGLCDMLSMGGLCGTVVSTHVSVKEPTKLRILGALADETGRPLSLRNYSLQPCHTTHRPCITAVCGTSMDSGKTHAVVGIIRGLRSAGHRVAAIKLTGTACCLDTWKMRDAGAWPVVDFVDGGFPSTYLASLNDLLDLFALLRNHAADHGVDHIVLEIADGLLQRETGMLLGRPSFVDQIDSWVLAASDPLGAAGAASHLRTVGITPRAIVGLLTCSPLAIREAIAATATPCITSAQLFAGELNVKLSPKAESGADREAVG